uniref:Uncharacterized protein n=1 Tax=Pediastrum angulosum TaxID=271408 RepID=A0A2U8GHI3_9CHLO|nr:hypothetical protein [Pediastrum angulosum]AWI68144.1 hypothetical protein [Pediastrum angulosum]
MLQLFFIFYSVCAQLLQSLLRFFWNLRSLESSIPKQTRVFFAPSLTERRHSRMRREAEAPNAKNRLCVRSRCRRFGCASAPNRSTEEAEGFASAPQLRRLFATSSVLRFISKFVLMCAQPLRQSRSGFAERKLRLLRFAKEQLHDQRFQTRFSSSVALSSLRRSQREDS